MSLKKITLCVLALALIVSMSIVGTVAYLKDTSAVSNTITVGKVDIKLDEKDIASADPNARTEEGNEYHFIPRDELYAKDPTVTVLKNSADCYVRAKITIQYAYSPYLAEAISQSLADNTSVNVNVGLNDLVTGLNTTDWTLAPGFDFRTKEDWTMPAGNTSGSYSGLLDINRDGEINLKDVVTITRWGEHYSADYELAPEAVFTMYYNTKVAFSTADQKLPAVFTGISYPVTVDPTDVSAPGIPYAIYDGMTISVEAQAIQADGFDDAAAAWAAFDAIS